MSTAVAKVASTTMGSALDLFHESARTQRLQAKSDRLEQVLNCWVARTLVRYPEIKSILGLPSSARILALADLFSQPEIPRIGEKHREAFQCLSSFMDAMDSKDDDSAEDDKDPRNPVCYEPEEWGLDGED